MNDLSNQLDAAMGDPPRSTVDLDRIVARQRRAGRLRVAGAGGATAAVLAGVLAGAVALTGTGPGPAAVTPGAAPTTTAVRPPSAPAPSAPTCPGASSPAPSQAPSPGVGTYPPTGSPGPDDGYVPPPPGAEGRLTAALKAAVRAEIGRTKLYPYDDDGYLRKPLEFFGGPCDPEPRFRNDYTAVAVFGPRPLTSPIMSVYAQTDERSTCTDDPACRVTRGPGGEVIRSISAYGDFQGRNQFRAFVAITKPDGTTLQLFASTPGGPSVRPPLSVAQLTRIGLTPGLTLDL